MPRRLRISRADRALHTGSGALFATAANNNPERHHLDAPVSRPVAERACSTRPRRAGRVRHPAGARSRSPHPGRGSEVRRCVADGPGLHLPRLPLRRAAAASPSNSAIQPAISALISSSGLRISRWANRSMTACPSPRALSRPASPGRMTSSIPRTPATLQACWPPAPPKATRL